MINRNRTNHCFTFSACCGTFLILLMSIRCGTEASPPIFSVRGPSKLISSYSSLSYGSLIEVRGGGFSDEDDNVGDLADALDEDVDSDSTEEIEESADAESTLVSITRKVVIAFGKTTFATLSALKRAIVAGFQAGEEGVTEEDGETEEEPSALSKVVKVLKRMWKAAFASPESTVVEEKNSSSVKKQRSEQHQERMKPKVTDFGSYLANTYNVDLDHEDDENRTPVIGGTLGDALREARSQAKLLVVFIPASQPGRGRKTSSDKLAITSLLSKEVSDAAKKRAKKKVDSGSYKLWGAKAGSPEAVTAIKRLRAKQLGGKGDKRPMLLVAYPAQVVDSSGKPKLVPRLVAQHHCSPPPSAESMAAWLNALRKRHSKQYSSMQHELKEIELYKERQEGYRSSIVSDLQRQEEEKKKEEERLASEEAERERLEQLERRREELKASLPEEPGKEVRNAITIALRFADGRTGQRRFTNDTQIATVLNWVDATYEMERETVILTTMNGQKSFSWKDSELEFGETGLGRMTGLRVSQEKNDTETEPLAQ